MERLRGAGFAAYFAGGCVRDELLGRTPKDWDIATDAAPEDVARLFARTVPVGAQFGIVRVIHDGEELEVARFRGDGPEADARGRDFTVNAMLYDPVADELLDVVGGREDLAARVLRATGDAEARFGEDWLRVLRAARLAAELELAIAPGTWAAMVGRAAEVMATSPERRRDEIEKMLTRGHGAVALRWLADIGLLAPLLPEVAGDGVEDDVEGLGARLDALGPCPAEVAWAAVLVSRGVSDPEAAAEGLAERLRLARRLARDAGRAAARAREIAGWEERGVAARKRWLRDDVAEAALALAAAMVAASELPERALAAVLADRDRWDDAALSPPALVTGQDLIAAGLRPGPRFKALLDAVEDATLEGRVTTRDEAVALATELAAS